jgi:hypothetical protein
MPDFGFVGASYEAPSITQDAQECINWFPEVDPTKGQGERGVVALYPTPGLTSVVALPNQSPVRGMRTISGGSVLMAVCGEFLYAIDQNFTPKVVGILNTGSGPVGITDNGVSVYITDGNNRYSWFINSQTQSAVFQGSVTGTTLTVSFVNIAGSGIGANQQLLCQNVIPGTIITGQLTGVTGGVGTYQLNISQTIETTQMYITDVAAVLTASINGATLTVNEIGTGQTLSPGMTIVGENVLADTIITAFGSGAVLETEILLGGADYAVNDTVTAIGGVYGFTPATWTVAEISLGVGSFTIPSPGTGYADGTYNNVQLLYVSGTEATTYPLVNITVSGGEITSISVVLQGVGFTDTTTVMTANASSIGGGTGFEAGIQSLSTKGSVTALTQTNAGQYTNEPVNPVTTFTSGSGVGLTLNLTFGDGQGEAGNYVVSNSQTVPETGYETMYALRFTDMPPSDGAFEGGTIVDVVDNYFIYNNPNTQQWAASNVLSPITYSLSFASKFTSPDNLVSLIANNGQVYLLGEKSSEVWSDQGTFPFAFQRIPASSSQHGIIGPFSVSRIGNTFAYLSRNTRGQAEIVAMNGYFPERISTHAVENTLVNEYIADAVAWTYQLEGHEVYVISFPSINLTWAYDVTTRLWHKWLWTDQYGNYNRHRGNCAAVFQGLVCVGDWENGQIYSLDPNNYTDNGGTIRRLRRCPHLVQDLQRFYFDELQIQFQPGVGNNGIDYTPTGLTGTVVSNDITYQQSPFLIVPQGFYVVSPGSTTIITNVVPPVTPTGIVPQAMLRWSNDGGSTWSNEYWTSIGAIGHYKNRAIWRRLGWARDRVFEVVVTDPVKAVIVSANLKASVGDN